MQQSADMRQDAQDAAAALHAGRHREAAEKFAAALARDPRQIACAIGLAYACKALGDRAAQERALDHALALDGRNLHALIMKGDLFEADGDSAVAGKWYSVALRVAETVGQLPAQLAQELARIRERKSRLEEEYEARIRQTLDEAGFPSIQPDSRFARSLDILLGRREIFVQEPKRYYFPGLPQIEFYDRLDFDWVPTLEAKTAIIRGELEALRAEGDSFTPYLEANQSGPVTHHRDMVGNDDWGAYYLWKDGRPVEDHVARFPETAKALQDLPIPRIEGTSPNILFSRLKPGASIPPHNGLINTRLICHLPLIVPDGCGFRVGSQTRPWVEGELFIFDDSIEHEAWNRSGKERVVLLFEIWRPELSETERAQVSTLLSSIGVRTSDG
ncbi:aspartyl beta-hydroxylase [Marinicauda algicola]|uniref:Aspartyl beta-hydroxylase n=1 Tax=Marinicauda algicola TaxID=2029849 RepID=A0A4S2GW58_9PROT|nr:aspartyl/asparaginyl beta-hydroxylase domain-containing protein [Marinicauda algicola]TGY87108.1 aspartyl beta-hydroxylase [Marinicauda algicola]